MPGVGKKTAQRFIYHWPEHNRNDSIELAKALMNAMEHVKYCLSSRTLSEKDICNICANNNRTNIQLCIVETPSDIHAIEQSSTYKGKYFVLSGYLSPIDDIGSVEFGLNALKQKLREQGIEEIILASNATVEGELTAHYISNMAKLFSVRITRIAHGLPIGGELEYADINTIAHALLERRDYN